MSFLIDNGNINIDDVRNSMENMTKQKLLSQHPYEIWEGKNGKWYTYLPDEKKGRILKKKSTKSAIHEAIIDYYKTLEDSKECNRKTFKYAYDRWLEYHQVSFKSPNTIIKYKTDYSRFFKGRDIEKENIEYFNEEKIKVFIISLCKEKSLSKKACKTLYGYMKNTFKSAKIHKDIKENPFDNIEAHEFYQFCTSKDKTSEERTISKYEFKLLYQKFYEDYATIPKYIPTYAVEFASLTGLRVGEIAALMWSDINNGMLCISRSEKYNRQAKEYYIGKTKNEKTRYIPLTDEIVDLLNRVRKAEKEYGYLTEYIFSNENGRIHAPIISSCAKNKCIQLGIPYKSIHAYRRTFSSRLKCNGISSTVVASLLGHTEDVNEQYYTYDITDMMQKQEFVQMVTKEIALSKYLPDNEVIKGNQNIFMPYTVQPL